MSTEIKKELQLEIAHVLFIDIVGYSKLLINEQRALLETLNQIVRSAAEFRTAEAACRLIKIPTGDGMALVFYKSPEEPVECALDISRALKNHPELQLRMGVHSGPVSGVVDVNGRTNVAGAGINMAQRVMDCGDAGHIFLSKHVAEDLEYYARWRPYLHELGEFEVKHGGTISIVNLYTDEVGNPAVPQKFKRRARAIARTRTGRKRSPAIPTKSIAVLPFKNLSHDPENEYFVEGIHEEILTRLSKIGDLKVISRASAQRLKSSPGNLPQMAKQLGVAHILEGSVQKAANQVRVNVRLINAATDSHLWAESFDRALTDIFKVESDIASNIAETLQARLTRSEKRAIAKRPTANPEAYELYLKGRFFWNKRTAADLRTAIEYFNRAIEKDPRYALVHAGLADCYCSLGFSFDAGSLSPNEAIPKAKSAALRALEMDDTLAEAHTSLAFISLNYDWDWPVAQREFMRAIELNPNYGNAHHWFSHYLTAMGRTGESLIESKRALELDQLDLIMNTHLGWHYFHAREYDVAIEQFHKTLELDPNYGLAHWYLGVTYEQKGSYQQALSELEKGKDLLNDNVGVEADMGHALALSGKRVEAEKTIDHLKELSKQRFVSSYQIALIYVGLDDNQHAFEWLGKAYAERSDLLVYLNIDPRIDSLRSDPRFADLVRRVGLQSRIHGPQQ